MKNIKIFWTIIIIMLPLTILADILVFFGAYTYVSDTTYEHYISDINSAAEVADELLANCNLKNPKDGELDSLALNRLCECLDMPYIYVIEFDEQKHTIKYLCIGTGKDASAEFKKDRHIGDIIEVDKNDYYRNALQGKDNNIEHINNRFDNTLTSYIKRTGKYAKNEIIATEISMSSVMSELNNQFSVVVLITILFTVVIVIIFALIINYRVQKPANIISKKMTSFVHDRKKGFEKLAIKGSKEFLDMADSFNSMAEEIDRYLDELSEMNRQKAELNIARDIQKGLLEPTEHEYDCGSIKTYMLPAKDVGGDLYDYIELKDGKICTIIADVSGKGVSAALFMSRAITMLHHYAESGMSPGNILYEYNNHLATHNPNMLFITTFVAIYDPKTAKLVYANAGHNFPYIISNKLIRLDGEQGMAAGIINDITYKEHTVTMEAGDLLFLYTDGVTEAKSKDDQFFSETTLEQILHTLTVSDNKEAISSVLKHLKKFTTGAKQADDITMLTLTITPYNCQKLHLEAKEENLKEIYDAISKLNLPKATKTQLRFMAEEMFINICSYAYPDGEGSADIIIKNNSRRVILTFIDSGVPFDPTKKETNIDEYDIDNDIGGLGCFLTFSYADDYSYKHDDKNNVLTITKIIN